MDSIMGLDRYKLEDAYLLLTHDLHQLLLNLDQAYFHNAQTSVILDLVDDKLCRAYTERPRDDDTPVIEVRKYTDKIPQGQDVCTRMVANLKTSSLDTTQQADVVKLFNSI